MFVQHQLILLFLKIEIIL